MIVVFYGLPGSGKTTLSKSFHNWMKEKTKFRKIHYIDSNKLKYVFEKASRPVDAQSLHSKAVDIAIYEKSINEIVLIAMPFYEKAMRQPLYGPDTIWIFLNHGKRDIGFKDTDTQMEAWEHSYEIPTDIPVEESLSRICKIWDAKMAGRQYLK